MLGILPVKVVGNGKEVNTYAFIDNGSDSTLVDRQLVESLGISGTKVNDFTLTTMHGSGVEDQVSWCHLKLSHSREAEPLKLIVHGQ